MRNAKLGNHLNFNVSVYFTGEMHTKLAETRFCDSGKFSYIETHYPEAQHYPESQRSFY